MAAEGLTKTADEQVVEVVSDGSEMESESSPNGGGHRTRRRKMLI